MYSVVNWDTDEIITTAAKLNTAKRICRKQGHTGGGNGDYYAPVARVQDANGYCVYNPKFLVGKHDHLKAETFIVAAAQSDDDEWQKVDTRGSLAFAVALAKNTIAPIVAVFTRAQWGSGDPQPRFRRDNRDKGKWPIRSGQYLINAQESDCF